MTLHEDFAALEVMPGTARITRQPDLFEITNLLAFGGAADRPTHVPTEVGSIGPIVLWESTGAADALPFWNTNFRSDVYLYIAHGGVRVEFKEPEGSDFYGTYEARTGDLLRLPKDIAHRTYSLTGTRRITLEILERDPGWATLGRHASVGPSDSMSLGRFSFSLHDDAATVTHGDVTVETPRDFFERGLRALVAWELHLGHNEFEGGFVVEDQGDEAVLRLPGREEKFATAQVLALFKAILARAGK